MLLPLVAACGACGPAGVRITGTEASAGSLEVVRFPDPWTIAGPHGAQFIGEWAYVVREIPGNPELVVRVRGAYGVDLSDVIQLVSFRGRAEVRRATAEEWERAVPLAVNERRLFEPERDFPSVVYAGHVFPRRGEHWGTALLSSGERWVAVVTYDGKPSIWSRWFHIPLGDLFPPDQPTRGPLYVQVFDASTGEVVQSAQGTFRGATAGVFYSSALWAGRRWFLMPLDLEGNECLVGLLPENASLPE